MTTTHFISQIAPIAQQLRLENSPLFPSVRVAQAALETGWKIPAWHNMVGFKVGSGKRTPYWDGKYVHKATWEVRDGARTEETAAFRAYASIEDSFRDQDILFQIPRYDRVRQAQTPDQQAHALYACGYATDPAYASKLIRIMTTNNLYQFDQVIKEDRHMNEKLDSLDQQVEELAIALHALDQRLQKIEARQAMAIPEWVKEAVTTAVNAGLVHQPQAGSWDFYRLLTIMHRAQLIKASHLEETNPTKS